jgi:hypothetical protein
MGRERVRTRGKPGTLKVGADRSPESDIGAPHFGAPMATITVGGRVAVKPVRAITFIALLAAACHLAGCMSSLGLQSDGSYVLERHEEQASCDALYKSIWGRIQLIKGFPAKAKAEQAAPAPTASLLFGRLFGGSAKGLKAIEEYDRERAHTYALQRIMREKKCVAVDVDLELAEVNAEMARLRSN